MFAILLEVRPLKPESNDQEYVENKAVVLEKLREVPNLKILGAKFSHVRAKLVVCATRTPLEHSPGAAVDFFYTALLMGLLN